MTEATTTPSKRALVLVVVAVIAIAGIVAAVARSGAKTASAVIPTGTRVVAALAGTISTESARVGDQVTLETREPIDIEGATSRSP